MDVLDKSGLFIFDIDRTLIDAYNSAGEPIWIKNMKKPYRLINPSCIEDAVGSKCELQDGVREFLSLLSGVGKELGFLSVGGMLEAAEEDQPSIIILKMFGLFKQFDGPKILLYKTARKDEHLKKYEDCVFFDDDEKHISAAQKLDNVCVVPRHDFETWRSLL